MSRANYWSRKVWLCVFAAGALVTQAANADEWKFEDAKVGELPKGWSAGKTGEGPGSVWKVLEDATAPAGAKVLAQTSSDGKSALFNLCVSAEPKLTDVEINLSLKPVSGKIDQGGGAVWRYQDANNYYIARVNPLEDNFRVYKVIGGKRTQLATADVKASAGEWHKLGIVHRGEHIQCSLNGKTLLDATDDAITTAGQIGLWTKADAVTSFDAITAVNRGEGKVRAASAQTVRRAPGSVAAGETSGKSPTQVFVVNTGDGSVSQVDLATMKEVSRHPVGPRPYGIAVMRDGKSVAVGVEDEECVKFFSLPSFDQQGKVPIGKMFNDHIILSQDGREIYVADFYSDDMFVIDVASRKETTRITGCSAPHVVKYGPLKKNVYVTCKKITGIAIIDPEDKKLLKFHQLNVNPRSLTFSPDESKVYFGSFWVNGFFEMDTESGKVTRLLALDPPAENRAEQEVTYHGV
ncbi:MAG TPA: family 16 glycoside hydrolase, partial [Planctomycetaceae bacterium]|nr:family 16 glycoside hydrolase [Planctomycetaceae bacterium]